MLLVGSSRDERDQLLFISTDEGSSFQRQAVSFSPDSLLFHPQDQDKLLAYCRDGRVGGCWTPRLLGTSSHNVLCPLVPQLFVSVDLGRSWTLLQERVTKDRVYWSVQPRPEGRPRGVANRASAWLLLL